MSEPLQDTIMAVARSMDVQDAHRFHELADGTVLYVARTPDAAGFTAATIVGEEAQLEFLGRLAQDRPRKHMPPPYSEAEVSDLEDRLGVALPPLLRFYLLEVSSAWRPRPFNIGSDRRIDIGPFGAVRVRSSTVLGREGEGTSSLLELVPFTDELGAGVVVAGSGHGLAVCSDKDGVRTAPLWSVLFETFF